MMGQRALTRAASSRDGTTILRAPVIAIADVHELDEAHDHGRAAEVLDQIERRVIVHAALDDGVDLDRREAGGDGGIDAGEHLIERGEAAAHAREHLLVQRVQAHRDALQAVGLQIDRIARRAARRWW